MQSLGKNSSLVDLARIVEQRAELDDERVELIASLLLVLVARAAFVVERVGRRCGRERVGCVDAAAVEE